VNGPPRAPEAPVAPPWWLVAAPFAASPSARRSTAVGPLVVPAGVAGGVLALG
jgi:hypothetical protein